MGAGLNGLRTALLAGCLLLVPSCGPSDSSDSSDSKQGAAEGAANLRTLEGTRTSSQALARELAPALARALPSRVTFTGQWSDCTPEVDSAEPPPPARYSYQVEGAARAEGTPPIEGMER